MEKDAASTAYPYSYVERLWDDMYLEGQWSIPINSNPFLALKKPPEGWGTPPSPDPQIASAAG